MGLIHKGIKSRTNVLTFTIGLFGLKRWLLKAKTDILRVSHAAQMLQKCEYTNVTTEWKYESNTRLSLGYIEFGGIKADYDLNWYKVYFLFELLLKLTSTGLDRLTQLPYMVHLYRQR